MGNCISGSSEVPVKDAEHMNGEDTNGESPSFVRTSDSSLISIPKNYKFKELEKTTDGFSNKFLLGEGAFGRVYRGKIVCRDGKVKFVAVKRMGEHARHMSKEWTAEVVTLGRLSHPNLVFLEGYCLEHGEHVLVYEYMPNGSVDYHLFQDWRAGTHMPCLTWQTRFKIALDAARGLAFLHTSEVIHRDFRSSNILLDEEFNAKLADFGLAKNVDGQTHVTTVLSKRSEGYLCPKFQETGFATKKVDVYAYGIVLLELITGRRAKEVNHQGQPIRLLQWAGPIMTAPRPDFRKLMDPYLPQPFPMDMIRSLARCVRVSVNIDPTLRPGMNDIVRTLEGMGERFLGDKATVN